MTTFLRPHRLLAGLVIATCCTHAPAAEPVRLPLQTYRDRVHGALAARLVGASIGSAFDGKTPDALPAKAVDLNAVDLGPDGETRGLSLELTFLKTLEARGLSATAEQVGDDLRDARHDWTHAADAARHNLRRGILASRSGHPRYNPHADDQDFQAAAGVFGLVAPGMPQTAGQLCDTFGGVIAYGDGVYGGRFVAGLYGQALVEPRPDAPAVARCVHAALASVPPDSAYAKSIHDVLAAHQRSPDDWRAAWRLLEEKWAPHDRCPDGRHDDANVDAKLNGDIAKTLEIAAGCGRCAADNAGTAAGVLGALHGLAALPKPVADAVAKRADDKLAGTPYDLASATAAIERSALGAVASTGGRTEADGDARVLVLSLQKPESTAELRQSDRALNAKQLQAWHQASVVATFAGMRQWDDAWELVNCGAEDAPKVRAHFGRQGVLVTHPVDKLEPAALERRVALPAGKPRLLLTVASGDDDPTVDWELRVLVDDKPVERRTINTQGKWQEVAVDLTRFAGKTVTLRVENAPGGPTPFAWETGYWANAKIVGE